MSLGPGKRLHVIVRPAQFERLKVRARSSGQSMGSLIREAIDRDLGRPVPSSFGALAGGAGRRLMAAGTITGPDGDPGSGDGPDGDR